MSRTSLLKRLIFYCGFILLQNIVSTVVFLPGVSDSILALISILVAGGFIYFLTTRYQKQLANYNPRQIGQTKVAGKWKYVLLGVIAMFAANIILGNFLPETTENQAGPSAKVLAVLTSALLFGLMHEPRLSMALLLYMTLGIVLACVYQKTEDLRCSMMVHMIYNGLGFLGMFLTLK